MATATVIDVDAQRFEAEVVERSHELPVVVDFWAAWCGPCRTLGPILEQAVEARDGAVVLAKVDVDADPGLAQRYRVQGIPAVKAFRDGVVVAEFTGALPRPRVDAFLDGIVPSEADRLAARAATADQEDAAALYRRALELDPAHRRAAVGLASLLADAQPERALELVRPHRPDPDAEAVVARVELADTGDLDEGELRARVASGEDQARLDLARLLGASSRPEAAVEVLLEAVRAGGSVREPAREQLLQLFTVLGDDHELVRRARPELAKALFR